MTTPHDKIDRCDHIKTRLRDASNTVHHDYCSSSHINNDTLLFFIKMDKIFFKNYNW